MGYGGWWWEGLGLDVFISPYFYSLQRLFRTEMFNFHLWRLLVREAIDDEKRIRTTPQRLITKIHDDEP